MTTMSDVNSLK